MPMRAMNLLAGKYKTPPQTQTNVESDGDIDDDETKIFKLKRNERQLVRLAANARRHDPVRRLLCHNVREVQERLYHNRFPAFNVCQWPMDSANELRNYPIIALSTPRPIFVSTTRSRYTDICHLRPLAYERWRRSLIRQSTDYNKVQQHFQSWERHGIYHKSIYDLSKLMHSGHDKYFHGSYDYYYSGGSLCIMPLAGAHTVTPTPMLLHTTGEDLRTLNLSSYDVTALELQQLYSKEVAWPSEIFEMQPLSCYRLNRPNIFAVRQKHGLSLRQITREYIDTNDDGGNCSYNVSTLNELVFKHEPIISMAQVASDAAKFLFSTMGQHIFIFDLSQTKPQMLHDVKASEVERVSFNVLRAWQGETVFWANDRGVIPIDLRTPAHEWPMRRCTVSRRAYFECDRISALAMSSNHNRVYVATSHKLHCLDVRYMSKTLEQKGAIACWTHQLEYAPAFIDTYADDNSGEEHVALASAKADDMVICELTTAQHLQSVELAPHKSYYTSYTVPYQPPTLEEALKHALEHAQCLRPQAQLRQRIKSCNTGLKFWKTTKTRQETTEVSDNDLRKVDDDDERDGGELVYLLNSNSLGDVLARKVTRRSRHEQRSEVRYGPHTDDIMCHYEREVIKKSKLPLLNYTTVTDLSAMKAVFECELLETEDSYIDADASDMSADKNITNDDANKTKRKSATKPKSVTPAKRQTWRKSVPALCKYTDALVPELLAVWDIDVEDGANATIKQLDEVLQSQEVATTDIVNNWLEQQQQVEVPQDTLEFEVKQEEKKTIDNTMNMQSSMAMVSIPIVLGNLDNDATLNNTTTFAINDAWLSDVGIDQTAYLNHTQIKQSPSVEMSSTYPTELPTTVKKEKKPVRYRKGF